MFYDLVVITTDPHNANELTSVLFYSFYDDLFPL